MIPITRFESDIALISRAGISALIQQAQFRAAEHPAMAKLREQMKPHSTLKDGVCMIPISGPLARNPDPFELFCGVEDSRHVLDMVNEAARNPDAKSILLSIDSPGGFLTGGPEIADAVRQAASRKPVVAWTGGAMASLAYWIGSQASEVVASRSAQVGSIGVFTTHVDYSRMLADAGIKVEVIRNAEADCKAAGIMGISLTDAQRSEMQSRIQASFGDFRSAVKSTRPQAQDSAMRGQVVDGNEAKRAGLVDRIGSESFAFSLARNLPTLNK